MSDNIDKNEKLSTRNAIEATDIRALQVAKESIENVGIVMSKLNKVGSHIGTKIKRLPNKRHQWLSNAISKILFKILKSNISESKASKELISTKKGNSVTDSGSFKYRALVSLSGLGSGFFGSFNVLGAAIFISEFYYSTRLTLRSILEIAKSEGENISDLDTQLACIQVFALGGNTNKEETVETDYYSTRLLMSKTMEDAGAYIAKYGSEQLGDVKMTSSNPVLMMIGLISTRLTVQITEKFILRAAPVLGALGGGTLNFVYMDHYQKLAKAHFTIRRLERKYSMNEVKLAFDELVV